MTGFSTLSSGTVISQLRANYDITTNASSTYAALLTAKGITDKAGLICIIYNNSVSAIAISVPAYTNYTGYPNYATATSITIPPSQSVTILTKVVGATYTITAVSAKGNINRGGAGQLPFQFSPNTTTFLSAGTAGQVLFANGPGAAPYWSTLGAGNLAGGVAGSLNWQSATSVTSKTAAGAQFTATGGGMAVVSSAGVIDLGQTNFLVNSNANTYSGGTLTLISPTTIDILASNVISPNSIASYLNTAGIPIIDGNRYVIWNNVPNNVTISLGNVQNPGSYTNGSFLTGSAGSYSITLRRKETVVLQQYNSTTYTIESTTQSMGYGGSWNMAQAVGAYVISSPIYDPNNWGSGSQIRPTIPGTYLVTASVSNGSVEIGSAAILKNPSTTLCTTNSQARNGYYSYAMVTTMVTLNGTTDYVYLVANTGGTLLQARLAIFLLN